MFIALVVFIVSFIIEVLVIIFSSPENPDGSVNTFSVFVFAINTGFLSGSFYALILVVAYWILKAYSDIRERKYLRRSAIFGFLVFLIVILKLYNILDYMILAGILIAGVTLEVIFSRKDKKYHME